MPSLSMGGQMDVFQNHHQTPNNITINQYVTFIEVAFADTRERTREMGENMKCKKALIPNCFSFLRSIILFVCCDGRFLIALGMKMSP